MSMAKVGIFISILNVFTSCNFWEMPKPVNEISPQHIAEIPTDKSNDDAEIGSDRRGK